MRELVRCIAWTLGLGGLALLVAMFTGTGIAQAEGPLAWLVFVVYSPFYLLAHGFGGEPPNGRLGPVLLPAAIAAQFVYFLVLVVSVRYLHRRRARR